MRSVHAVIVSEDLFAARQGARRVAAAMGFSRIAVEEIVIVASELVSNILKYGIRGTLEVGPVEDAALGPGIELRARDCGPPIRDFAMALEDGYDDQGPLDAHRFVGRRGIGAGLGAVRRLTDALEYEPGATGKELRAVRYLSQEGRRSLRSLGPGAGTGRGGLR